MAVQDLPGLFRQMDRDGLFSRMIQSRLVQFGTPARRYIGAEILPEIMVPENRYQEVGIKLRSVVAPAGPRYGPAQLRGNELFAHFDVMLSNSDVGSEFNSEQYEQWNKFLATNSSMSELMTALQYFDTRVTQPLVIHNEVNRWQAIELGQVTLYGDNGYTEVIPYPNPAGHRFNAANTWSDNTKDPFVDIFAAQQLLESKGYEPYRIVTSTTVLNIMGNNTTVKSRTGFAVINGSGVLTGLGGRVDMAKLNQIASNDGVPPFEVYNLQYADEGATHYFTSRNSMIMFGRTSQSIQLDLGDSENIGSQSRLLTDTIGYTAMGKAAGQATPGRVSNIVIEADKPPRVKMEGWQTSLPIINQPESFVVIGSIS